MSHKNGSKQSRGLRPGIRSWQEVLVLIYFSSGPVYLILAGSFAMYLCTGAFTLPSIGCVSIRFETVLELMRQINSGQVIGLLLAVFNLSHGMWELVLKRVPADQSRAEYHD